MAEVYGEIRVLIGYRVGVMGFLSATTPEVKGNFAFKDCWLGLEVRPVLLLPSGLLWTA